MSRKRHPYGDPSRPWTVTPVRTNKGGDCRWCGLPLDETAVCHDAPESSAQWYLHRACRDKSLRIAHGPPAHRIPAQTVAEYTYDARAEAGADGWKADDER